MDENHLSSMFRAVGYFVRRKIGCGSLNQAAAAFFAFVHPFPVGNRGPAWMNIDNHSCNPFFSLSWVHPAEGKQ